MNATGQPSLRHQRSTATGPGTAPAEAAQVKGVASATARKYRKGACENCGALTHGGRECLERPRRVGAKWTGTDLRPDEYLVAGPQDFSGKRDRWAGFDPHEYDRVVQRYERIEEERKRLREAEPAGQASSSEDAETDVDADVDAGVEGGARARPGQEELQYAEGSDMPGQKVDAKARMTVRNLRIREDTAKYLRNLDPESAYYDPKTRSMRENPTPDAAPEALVYAGDNFVRQTGDVGRVTEMQVFAWQAHERGQDLSLQANPSEVERLYRQQAERHVQQQQQLQRTLLARYGGPVQDQDAADARPEPEESDVYVEYSATGRVLRSQHGGGRGSSS